MMQLKKRNRLASKRAERNDVERGQLVFKDIIADRLVSTKEGLVKFAKIKELLKNEVFHEVLFPHFHQILLLRIS